MKEIRPPKLALRFFRWYCHPKLLKYIEGDLMELYEERIKEKGKRKADIKFIIDVLLLFRPSIIRPVEGYENLNTYGMYQGILSTSLCSVLSLHHRWDISLCVFGWRDLFTGLN